LGRVGSDLWSLGPVHRRLQPLVPTMNRRLRGRIEPVGLANLASSSSFGRSHTLGFFQSCRRRQQVGTGPYPNLTERSHRRIPVLNMNRIPFGRSEAVRRHGYLLRRGFDGDNEGSIHAHSLSSTIGVPIPLVLFVQMARVAAGQKGSRPSRGPFETASRR
jgi:hypothetical protein